MEGRSGDNLDVILLSPEGGEGNKPSQQKHQ